MTPDELAPVLLERAEYIRRFLTAKIPARFRSTITADDVLQDAWIAAFRHADDVAGGDTDALNSWVRSIAERKLVDALKAAHTLKRGGRGIRLSVSRSEGSAVAALFDRLTAHRRTPSQCLSEREAADALLIAMSSLNEQQRRAIQLRHFEGLPVEQIATTMNKSEAAVSSLLFRGMLKLRSAMGTASRYFSDVRSSESSTASTACTRGAPDAEGISLQPGARR